MAREVVQLVKFIDDFDGTEVDEKEIETIKFGYRGKNYSIDLKLTNAKKFDDAIKKWVAAASEETTRSRAAASTRRSTGSGRSKEQLAAIRAWLIQNNYEVAPRGRIKAELIEAFDAAH